MRNAFIIIAGVALGAAFFFGLNLVQFYTAIYKPKNTQSKPLTRNPKPKNSYNILILGYGGEGHEGAYLTDTMMVAHVDLKTKRVTIVSIPRDIWIDLPTKSGDKFGAKINTVFQMELFPETFPDVKPENLTKKTVEFVTGLTIDNYVTIDFSGFKQAIDVLGGIDISVARSFTDKQYPVTGKEKDLCGKDEQFAKIQTYLDNKESTIAAEREAFFKDNPDLETFFNAITENPEVAFPCRYEELHFDAGLQHMDGERALKFVRSRHGDTDGGDFGRANRQQLFLEAVKEKVLTIGFVPKIIPLLDELKDNVRTDIAPNDLQKFITEATGNAQRYKTGNIVMSDNDYLDFGRSDDGQSILVPKVGKNNWTAVHAWIRQALK